MLNNIAYPQETALRNFNDCCECVRGGYDRGEGGLIRIREAALEIFIQKGHSVPDLTKALFSLRPHWGRNGDDEKYIKAFFRGLHNDPEWYKNDEIMFVTMSAGRYLRELKVQDVEKPGPKQFTPFEIDQIRQDKFCQIHPDRPWYNKKRRICASCYQKLRKLDLLDYPFDAALVEVLKVRLMRNQKTVDRCVNHDDRIALPNGLCVECNQAIGATP